MLEIKKIIITKIGSLQNDKIQMEIDPPLLFSCPSKPNVSFQQTQLNTMKNIIVNVIAFTLTFIYEKIHYLPE